MNFLLVNYEYPPIGGGAATATSHIARELVGMGHTVTVMTSRFGNQKGSVMEKGIRVIRCLSLRKRADRSNLLEMFTFLLSACLNMKSVLDDDIEASIIFFAFPCGPIGLLGWKLAQVPYVISLRGGDVPGTEPRLHLLHKILKPLRHLIYNRSSAIVANSEGLKQLAQTSDPCTVFVIPNGIDVSFFSPCLANGRSYAKPFNFLFIGRFIEQKNLFYLMDRIAELRRSVFIPFQLSMVGDGPLRSRLESHADKLDINRIITWHGWLDKKKLRDIYHLSHCLLLPSLYEGMSNVALEAMACGLPVIASDVIGNSSVIRHGETGFLFDLNNPKDGLEAMKCLLSNPEQAQDMGKQGRIQVMETFSWRKTAEAYVRLFLDKPLRSE